MDLRGIKSNKQNLISFIKEYKADVIMLQETKLKNKEKIKISDFVCFEENLQLLDDNQIAHGGVSRPDLKPTKIHLRTNL